MGHKAVRPLGGLLRSSGAGLRPTARRSAAASHRWGGPVGSKPPLPPGRASAALPLSVSPAECWLLLGHATLSQVSSLSTVNFTSEVFHLPGTQGTLCPRGTKWQVGPLAPRAWLPEASDPPLLSSALAAHGPPPQAGPRATSHRATRVVPGHSAVPAPPSPPPRGGPEQALALGTPWAHGRSWASEQQAPPGPWL